MLSIIVTSMFVLGILFTLTSVYIDYRKKISPPRKYPLITFLLAVHNGQDNLGKTVRSIFNSYKNLELIIIDDCSTDGTQEVLKDLQKKYQFRLINNSKNLGKAASINKGFSHSKGEIIFTVDADIILNKKAINEMISRLEKENVGAVTCRYKSTKNNFWAELQSIEYGMSSNIYTAHNIVSSVALWGGSSAVKREVFVKTGLLSKNAITEDGDLAMKIREQGLKVEECKNCIHTHTYSKLSKWTKQRIRWNSGWTQNYLRHFKMLIAHPISLYFWALFLLGIVLAIVTIFTNISSISSSNSGNTSFSLFSMTKVVLAALIFPVLISPYVLIHIPETRKHPLKLAKYLLAYAYLYVPILTCVAVLGDLKGVYMYFKLKDGGRGW